MTLSSVTCGVFDLIFALDHLPFQIWTLCVFALLAWMNDKLIKKHY